MKTLTSLLLAIYASVALAQTNPEAGFVITLNNDTLWGTLELRTDEINMTRCTFKQDGTEEWKIYKPYEINGYRFASNGKYYVSRTFTIEGKEEKLFAEYMMKGMLNVYFIPKGEHYFLENEDGTTVEYSYDNGNNTTREKLQDKVKPLFYVIGKSVKASEDVKLTEMRKGDIIKMARDYHNEVCKSNEDCIEFEYDERNDNTKIRYRFFVGAEYLMKNEVYMRRGLAKYASTLNATSPVIGFGIEDMLPRVSPGLSVQALAVFAYDEKSLTMERTDNSHDVPLYATTKDIHLHLEVGPAYTFNATSKGIKPLVRGGFTAEANFHRFEGDKPTKPVDTNLGLYAGGGLIIPLGKIDMTVDLTYRCYVTTFPYSNFVATVGVRL